MAFIFAEQMNSVHEAEHAAGFILHNLGFWTLCRDYQKEQQMTTVCKEELYTDANFFFDQVFIKYINVECQIWMSCL